MGTFGCGAWTKNLNAKCEKENKKTYTYMGTNLIIRSLGLVVLLLGRDRRGGGGQGEAPYPP